MLSSKKGSVLQDKLVAPFSSLKCKSVCFLEGTWSRGLGSRPKEEKVWCCWDPHNLACLTCTHSPQSIWAGAGSCTSWPRTCPGLGS